MQKRRLRVASGATAPGPALQASDVDDQSTLEIKQIIVFNLCLHVT